VGWKIGESLGDPRFVKSAIVRSWIESPLDSSTSRPYIRESTLGCEIRALSTMSNTFVSFALGRELNERPQVDLAFNVFEFSDLSANVDGKHSNF
jgi:hypothetical protein